MKKTVIVIPTFNEKENIEELIDRLCELSVSVDILIVDDNSSDGTAAAVKERMCSHDNVFILERFEKKGRGSADVDGYRWALAHGADYIISMDADLSHDPAYIPHFLKAAESSDIVIGSRLIPGGGITGRHVMRNIITFFANLYIRLVLALPVKDCTTGYRCFKAHVIRDLNPDDLYSVGPSIIQEMLYKAHLKGFAITEIPIVFHDRKFGTSTFDSTIIAEGLKGVLKLRFNR